MTEEDIYSALLVLSFILAGVTYTLLSYIDAPYGRHIRRGLGPSLNSRLGWLVMESPSVFLFAVLFVIGDAPKTITLVMFLLMWEAHYIHRGLIYPFMLSDGRKKLPLLIVLMGFSFNLGNAYLNGRYLFSLSGGYDSSWLLDPRFIIGLALFVSGYVINRWADRKLRLLREPGELGYKIPHGGLYEWVSCPNYLGEIIEWTGWALATWSMPGLSFAVWTFANLAPRARAHHAWYRQYFKNYPQQRKALIPRLW